MKLAQIASMASAMRYVVKVTAKIGLNIRTLRGRWHHKNPEAQEKLKDQAPISFIHRNAETAIKQFSGHVVA